MKLRMEVGLGPGHIVLHGEPVPPPLKGHSHEPPLIFGPCLLMSVKMPLSMEVGLGRVGSDHTVLDGDPASLKRGTAPNFRPMSIVVKRLDGGMPE